MLGSVERTVQGRETVIRWRIPGFSSVEDDEEDCYSSPVFECFGRSWNLDLLPNGRRRDPSEGFLVLSLFLWDVDPPLPVCFHVAMETEQGETEKWESGRHKFADNHPCIEARGIPRSEVFRRADQLLPGNQLTIVVSLEEGGAPSTDSRDVFVQTEVEVGEAAAGCFPEKKGVRKMQEDMNNLLATGEGSDVIVKVRGKEFPAHRNILRARSSVFKTMFDHDTVVEIDCDPDTFPDFLTYLYTGSTKHIHGENVCSLYASADKYCVGELREACVIFMKNNLSAFCHVTSLTS